MVSFSFMRRNWLVVLSWCVGFVWAVALILNARRAPEIQPPVAVAKLAETRGIEPVSVEQQPIEIAKQAAYAGNTKSYKFHKLSCGYADCPNCTARFATRDEAVKAGYRPCGTCKP